MVLEKKKLLQPNSPGLKSLLYLPTTLHSPEEAQTTDVVRETE